MEQQEHQHAAHAGKDPVDDQRAHHLVDVADPAEAFSVCAQPEELCALLDENGNAALSFDEQGTVISAGYDAALGGDRDGHFRLTATWEEEAVEAGRLIRSTITVTSTADGREIYSLQTAAFRKEAAA